MFRIISGMQCPYCQTPLTETSEECSYCSLSLQSANSLLGPVPRLTTGLNDILSVLEKKAQSKATKSLAKLSQRFPQVRMHIIINKFNPNYPLRPWPGSRPSKTVWFLPPLRSLVHNAPWLKSQKRWVESG